MHAEPSVHRAPWRRRHIPRLLLAALAVLVFLPGCRSIEPAPAPLRVMSVNVRVPVDTEGSARWEVRRDALARVIADADPDLVGTQELVLGQAQFLVARLPEYDWFGLGRRGGQDDEHMGVFYRRDRLRLLESGHYWLSDTPEVAGSISWGHPYPRMLSWGLFERRADGQRLYLLNTHLPYRESDGAARVQAAALILRQVASLPTDVPVVLVGDFNDVPGSPVHRALTAVLADAWETAPRRDGPEGSFHAFTGRAERRIDWVLARGLRVQSVRHLDTRVDGVLPSDHFPVLVEFGWE